MTSPYITEAMRRRELPVRVAVLPAPMCILKRDVWVVKYSKGDRVNLYAKTPSGEPGTDDAKIALAMYYDTINELSKES